MAATVQIDTRGLAEAQRDMRRMAPAMAKAITAEMRLIGKDVGLLARTYARRDVSARGAKTIKWSAARSAVSIYTDLYWMRIWEGKGDGSDGFYPGGGSTFVRAEPSLTSARDDKAEDSLAALDEVLDRAAQRVGGFR